MSLGETERFDPSRRDASSFTSGEDALDAWLRSYASQSQRRGAARTFVALDGDRVVGYYALVAATIDRATATATATVGRGLSHRFPIPAALIARLAVDTTWQGRGLGRSLLLDALVRILRAGDDVAIRAVLVHAKTPRAARFYANYGFEASGFEASGVDEPTLMMPLTVVRATFADG